MTENKSYFPSLKLFDDHEEENQNGRYQVIIDSKGDQYWYDTRYGDKVAICANRLKN